VSTEIEGVILIEPDVHRDERGFFLETYHQARYHEAGLDAVFVQDNHSKSARGTLRGLHMQVEHAQTKLVRAISGCIWDVAVDVRTNSPTFGRYVGAELSAENHKQLYIPCGMLHGFVVLSEEAEIEYKCSDFYDPASEVSVLWNDPEVAIQWPIDTPTLSERDAKALPLSDIMDRLRP
jgi:dTDP-4-dehydrorhamnose 3,5-epimerase